MTGIRVSKWVAAAACLGVSAAWWLLRGDSTPYELQDTPKVEVAVRPAESSHSDAKQVAEEAEPLIKVYLQRLRTGDAAAR